MDAKKFWDEKIETMPRDALDAYQLKILKTYLNFTYTHSAYYHNAFNKAKVKPDDLQTLADLRKFPFVNKSIERERQLTSPILGDMIAVYEKDIVFISASSGSSGVPTVSPFTQEDFQEFQDVESRLFWMVGMRPEDRYLHALNFSLFVGGPDVIGAQNLGALSIWAGTVPSERMLYIMKEFKPTITWTTPSYAWYLGETALKQGVDPAKDLSIRKIIVAGEPGGSIPVTRKAIEKLWNAELFDFYGISDIFGACAGMCEQKDGLHLAEDHILLEVLDPVTLEPVSDGERGEMVLTTLKKRARPMIRFRTGDIITANRQQCTCGRTHVRIKVHGRLDDMFIVSGVNVFPSDIEFVIRSNPGLTGEYRITLLTEDNLTKFLIEAERNPGALESDEVITGSIERVIKTRLGVRPKSVILHGQGVLPRETHKAKRLIDLRKKPESYQI